MSLTPDKILDIVESLENFLSRNRPPENIRDKVDVSYSIEDHSVRIYETRPRWDNPNKIIEANVAKATYVKSRKKWKVYWLRADLKWYPYDPMREVKNIDYFVKLVEEDEHGCFWG